jgi:CDP-4-dehydro-6-deoxyglucose reductase
MKEGDEIRFEGPIGDFSLRESERPIVFVAGATGFAPVKSMVEDAFQRGLKRQIHLYWGVRRSRPISTCPNCRRAGRANTRTSTSSRCSPSRRRKTPGAAAPAWSTKPSSKTSPSSSRHEIYACGSVRMVEAIFPFLKQHGAEDGMPASRMPSASRPLDGLPATQGLHQLAQ